MLHAPESGSTVRIVAAICSNTYWPSHFVGALRPTANFATKS
jgi:hypothetical protein